MILQGKLIAEAPIYRGNARKTLFTRDGDGSQRLVSLAGEIAGTAEALMDAFVGTSRNGKNTGLLNRLWLRLYDAPMPENLISQVECHLQEDFYPRDHFFDLRMGIKLDEDRWAAEANANYKMETLYRHSVFDLVMRVNDSVLQQQEQAGRLYYVLRELQEGRFWFGAGKSKGLGRCRLEMDLPFSPPASPPRANPAANHLRISLTFDATNPVLVGWNWGKVDQEVPAFAAVEGRLLVGALRDLPEPIRQRLEMGMAGPILSPEDCKGKLARYLPEALAGWLGDRSFQEEEVWTFPTAAVAKLAKGKYPVPKKAMARIQPLTERTFPSREAAEAAFHEALGKDARKYRRVLEVLEHQRQRVRTLDRPAWNEVAATMGIDAAWTEPVAEQIQDPAGLVAVLAQACQAVLPPFYQQMDQQISLLQSDLWVDDEIALRQEHLRIKTMLLEGEIDEGQWGDPEHVPDGVRNATWREFIEAHPRVQYRHMTHPRNLNKSITNDRNHLAFLQAYRDRTRQELAQPDHIDFRAGGASRREVSRRYGKPYDTVFMRMLSWAPSSQEHGSWEIYIPGATLKGAFRKRASQVLKTLWGESRKTTQTLDRLFGTQGQRGLIFFSDAYLVDPQAPGHPWCSMDGIRMDPRTGRPVEEAKADFLFGYGAGLKFYLDLDLQDLSPRDLEAFSLLTHLLQDFQRGDIPLGGEKTCGFGWVRAKVNRLDWRTVDPNGISEKLFGRQDLRREGFWYQWPLEEEAATGALTPSSSLVPGKGVGTQRPPVTQQGFISHRAFGGYCGILALEAQVLTPLAVQESGEPSFRVDREDGPVNGWDFFSLSPPEAAQRSSRRSYALPSKSLKGMIRHVYSMASNSCHPSPGLSQLNPADHLFGYVGKGPDQALMGRLAFDFGIFDDPELAWFKVPYPYGTWQYLGGQWRERADATAAARRIGKQWRLFLHTPIAPCVQSLDDFHPDTSQANYFRAILPGGRARFRVRFWNLEDEELQRLIWCLVLEERLAHKMGKARYLGLGSLRLHLLPDSFLTTWVDRYAADSQRPGDRPIQVDEWRHPRVIHHYEELCETLNADSL